MKQVYTSKNISIKAKAILYRYIFDLKRNLTSVDEDQIVIDDFTTRISELIKEKESKGKVGAVEMHKILEQVGSVNSIMAEYKGDESDVKTSRFGRVWKSFTRFLVRDSKVVRYLTTFLLLGVLGYATFYLGRQIWIFRYEIMIPFPEYIDGMGYIKSIILVSSLASLYVLISVIPITRRLLNRNFVNLLVMILLLLGVLLIGDRYYLEQRYARLVGHSITQTGKRSSEFGVYMQQSDEEIKQIIIDTIQVLPEDEIDIEYVYSEDTNSVYIEGNWRFIEIFKEYDPVHLEDGILYISHDTNILMSDCNCSSTQLKIIIQSTSVDPSIEINGSSEELFGWGIISNNPPNIHLSAKTKYDLELETSMNAYVDFIAYSTIQNLKIETKESSSLQLKGDVNNLTGEMYNYSNFSISSYASIINQVDLEIHDESLATLPSSDNATIELNDNAQVIYQDELE